MEDIGGCFLILRRQPKSFVTGLMKHYDSKIAS
jgi:hypothetical protein